MPLIAFDVETTTINKGDPYHPNNKLVAIGFYGSGVPSSFYKEEILQNIDIIRNIVYNNTLITFNGKFDIAWLCSLGIDISKLNVYDVQLAEFLISNQSHRFASLNDVAFKYLKQQKLDVVKAEYWDKGIDTWFIPKDILISYLNEDTRITYECFFYQQNILKKENKWKLFQLGCKDLLILCDMERNGINFDKESSIQAGKDLDKDLELYKSRILSFTTCPNFNLSSGDHVSCLLYGGTIAIDVRFPIGVYKTGKRIGEPRYKIFTQTYQQDQLVKPIKGSELKKEGYYSVNEETLLSLKPRSKEVQELIANILAYTKLETVRDKYYLGIPKLIEEKGWNDGKIHGQINQCVVATGRLSASQPNQQNFDDNIKGFCYSAYT